MVTVFMSREAFNKEFDHESDYFNGYFSNTGIDDIDGHFIASEITKDDMTKTSRQLEVSMGNMVGIRCCNVHAYNLSSFKNYY